MPMMQKSGWHGIPWGRCDRCGWQYDVSQLVMQNGLLLCRSKCYDRPLMFYRPMLLADAVSGGVEHEMEPVTSEVRTEPNVEWPVP